MDMLGSLRNTALNLRNGTPKVARTRCLFFDLTDPFEFVVPCCQSSNWPIGALGEPVLPYKHWDDLSDHK